MAMPTTCPVCGGAVDLADEALFVTGCPHCGAVLPRGADQWELLRLRTEVERLRAAIPAIGQAAHAAHGGRGGFRWCGERCCALAYGVERGQAGAR